ncbi:MAG TPA: ABC transporter permease [Solirubrobacteraceae bacterium]|nr:ABC transporter permease [Solirubrobacteraceae bacterium]
MARARASDRERRRRRSVIRLLAMQVGYQLRLLVRSPLSAFATLVIPLMVLLAIGLLYSGTRLQSREGIAYIQFLTPAMIAFATVNACYMSVVSSVTLAREEGILKRFRSTPLPPWVYMAGRLGSAGLVTLASAAVVIAIGAGVYGFQMVWSAIPTALLVLAVAIFCFCSLGLAITVIVPSKDSALPVAWGTMLPLCFVSDVFQPIDGAPHWLRATASAFPLRPLADALENAFNPLITSTSVPWAHLALAAIWGCGAAAFALLFFRWEPSGRSGRQRLGLLRRHRSDSESGGRLAVSRLQDLLERRPVRPQRRRRAAEQPNTAADRGNQW